MANELPYFKFKPAQYLTGSIQLCSLEAQGLFTNIQAIYWQRQCELTVDQVMRKFNREDLFNELVKENIFKVKKGKITIDFLLTQQKEFNESHSNNSLNGKKGAESKWNENSRKRSERMTEARKKGTHTKIDWLKMVDFFDKKCVRCFDDISLKPYKDHIKPIYQGGSDSIKNIQPLCSKCSSSKGSESIDHRPYWCEINTKKMPSEWLAEMFEMPSIKNIQEENILNKEEENIQTIISMREVFFSDLPNSSYILEIARDLKLTEDYVKAKIIDFRIAAEPEYPTFLKFATHFKNWLRKNPAELTTISREEKLNTKYDADGRRK